MILEDYFEEMLLIIYILMVGEVVKLYFNNYCYLCGFMVSINDIEWVEEMFDNVMVNDVWMIVVIDLSVIFGIGD